MCGSLIRKTLISLCLAGLLAACGSDSSASCCDSMPPGGLLATFAVGDDSFKALITDPDGMAEARALWNGSSNASIPNGVLACSPEDWNAPWTWHLQPESVRFAEVTTEVCDGTPSYVQENCASFGERYCPWSAQMTRLQDCTSDPACPDVPRP